MPFDCNQDTFLPVRAYNYVVRVAGKKTEQTVFCLPKFTIPDDKELVVEMNEKEEAVAISRLSWRTATW